MTTTLDPRKLVTDQMDTLGWEYEDASADVNGAEWALRVTKGPPVKLYVALPTSGQAIIVQSRIEVTPEHRAAVRRMKPRERKHLTTRVQLALLNDPRIESSASSKDGQAPDAIEIRGGLFEDEWRPSAVRDLLARISNASVRTIVLVQDAAFGAGDGDIQQLSVDPQATSSSYDSWGANLVVVSADCMSALERLRKEWHMDDTGKVIERLIHQHGTHPPE